MNIFAAVAMIAILVFIHEFGHFIVAKACGVHVKVFSIGFGRRVVGFDYGGTEYRLSLLPFGGYVQMAGADPFGTGEEDDDELDDPERAFLRRPVWQRLLVVSAGPAFNLVLPLVLFTVLLMAGEPQPSESTRGRSSARACSHSRDRSWRQGRRPQRRRDVIMECAREGAERPSSQVRINSRSSGMASRVGTRVDVTRGRVRVSVSHISGPRPPSGSMIPSSPAGQAGLETGEWLCPSTVAR